VVQLAPELLTKPAFDGRASLTVTSAAALGPLLSTTTL
jgi:hypothetical protein